jgi:hypothetical protein
MIHDVDPPMLVVAPGEIGAEVTAAALLAAKRRARDEMPDGDQVQLPPRVDISPTRI